MYILINSMCKQHLDESSLIFKGLFKNKGKQGITGVYKYKGKHVVFKFSNAIDYSIDHEEEMYKQLQKITSFCPHFVEYIGGFVNKKPLPKDQTVHIPKRVILLKYINGSPFYDYISNPEHIQDHVIQSSLAQILLSLRIAQHKVGFSHNDLHPYNIMMQKCNMNKMFLYVLNDHEQILIPTYGHYPVLIDYGCAFANTSNTMYLNQTMSNTDIGCFSYKTDWFSDARILLATTSDIVKRYRNKDRHPISKAIDSLMEPLYANMDAESGWLHSSSYTSSATYVSKILSEHDTHKSILFTNHLDSCIEIIQSIIILPFERQDFSKISTIYSIFLKEWYKIESQMLTTCNMLHTLKCVVNAAKEVHGDYMFRSTRKEAVKTFKESVFKQIDSFLNYCVINDVHWEKLLCSLLEFGRNIEGIFYVRSIDESLTYKHILDHLPFKNLTQIYKLLEPKLLTPFLCNEETRINVIDSIHEKQYTIKLTKKLADMINSTELCKRGKILYDKISND